MKIIDFDRKGNVVRLFLGDDSITEWWGDDWNDAPYDCNAGTVYEEYVSGAIDVAVPFDAVVLEPCDGCWGTNCRWSKEDMFKRSVPCLVIVPQVVAKARWSCDRFNDFVGSDNVRRIYYGDDADDIIHRLMTVGCMIIRNTAAKDLEGE